VHAALFSGSIWNLATPDIEGFFEIEAFDIEVFDIEAFDISLILNRQPLVSEN
jgi:hypothetical protein